MNNNEYEYDYYDEEEEALPSLMDFAKKQQSLEDWIKEKKLTVRLTDEI